MKLFAGADVNFRSDTTAIIAGSDAYKINSYATLDLALDGALIVFWGENGAGKTNLIEALSLSERARPLIPAEGSYERARQRRRERRELAQIPEWFSADDLIAAPWERGERSCL